MISTAIKIRDLAKVYQLGEFSSRTLARDFKQLFKRPSIKPTSIAALKDVSFSVDKGEVVGIIGKNGSGKSTLLKILSRITLPTNGIVEIFGRVGALLEVGTAMHPDLTGRENIYLNGGVLGMDKTEVNKKIGDIIDFFGYPEYIDTPIKRYSSGMKVRLGFSVAAFLEPDVLIIDEVLAVGDMAFQKQAINKIAAINKKKEKTILFVSHNLSLVNRICSRVVVLDKGMLTYDGETTQGIKHYLASNHINLEEEKEGNQYYLPNESTRKGSGELRITKVNITCTNNIANHIVSGNKAQIVLYYTLNKPLVFSKLIVSISIYDLFEKQLVRWVSDEMGISFKENENQKGRIVLNIPKFMLREGEYYLNMFLSKINTREENLIDNIEKSIKFEVIGADYWNSGVLMRKADEVFMDADFNQE